MTNASKKSVNSQDEETKHAAPQSAAVLDKLVIDTMEDFYRFVAFQKRPGIEKNPCIVSSEIYNIVTEGDIGVPLFWKENVAVIDSARKVQAIEILKNSRNTNIVVI